MKCRTFFMGFLLLSALTLSTNNSYLVNADGTMLLSCKALPRIYAVAISSNNDLVLASWNPGEARLWDLKTGKTLKTFIRNFDAVVSSVAFSPDGKYILTGGTKEADLWEINTGNLVRIFPRNVDDVYGTQVMFLPNGTHILTGGYDGATLWEQATGRIIYTFPGNMDQIAGETIQLSSDGKYVMTSDSEGQYLWSTEDGKRVFTFPGFARFTPDSKSILIYYQELLYMWDIKTQLKRQFYQIPISRNLTFSPDGNYILSDDRKENVFLYDTRTSARLKTFPSSFYMYPYQFSTSSKYLLVSSRFAAKSAEDTAFLIWNIIDGKEMSQINIDRNGVTASTFSKDDKYWLTGFDSGEVKLWDVVKGNEVQRFC